MFTLSREGNNIQHAAMALNNRNLSYQQLSPQSASACCFLIVGYEKDAMANLLSVATIY